MFLAETGSLGVPSTRATAHFQISRGCAVVTTLSEFRQRTLACLGNENSNKLVNLWHMLQFNARSFVTLVNDLADLESRARIEDPGLADHHNYSPYSSGEQGAAVNVGPQTGRPCAASDRGEIG